MNHSLPYAPKVIKEQREKLVMSQADLARKAGLTRQTISNLEAGRYDPSYRTLRVLSRTFEIPLGTMLSMMEGEDG
jgi:DNA-binding XRE family transcriptional regulator